jgi:hypothetical protein
MTKTAPEEQGRFSNQGLKAWYVLPTPGLRRFLDRFQQQVIVGSASESGLRRLTLRVSFQQVINRVDEGVLVTDDVSGGPINARIRLVVFVDVDGTKTLAIRLVFGAEIFQFVHTLEVERNRTLLAVDFKGVEIAAARSKPRRFEDAHRPILETRHESRRVIDRNLAHLGRCLSGQSFSTCRRGL